MEFDQVHHIQRAYRKLIACISKPGTINSLKDVSDTLSLPLPCNNSVVVLALMLLDTEVSFHISGRHGSTLSKYISQLTYSRTAPVEDADYIFVMQDNEKNQLTEIIKGCKSGTLINPHVSATLIVETREISSEKMYVLSGPGIREEKFVGLYLNAKNWKDLRKEKNSEYPLGIDIFFFDEHHNLLALPRTTVVNDA
ncbi:phosphonate C-P lyase system protein PhnH [Desulfitibacter alkalitolerans]|uniref:phosphonate C-P lyase system protein PhnH n=1 Tax=Desulfitibacter alkalitolerans TaxID=264641 RepID=UPI00047F82C7|nr:phosphonate C-P lyase system protein PhnH [Desulfitibacter alkalitolerans]